MEHIEHNVQGEDPGAPGSKLANTGELGDPEDPSAIATWMQTEITDYITGHEYSLDAAALEGLIKEMAIYLATKLDIDPADVYLEDIATHVEQTEHPRDGSVGTTKGTLFVFDTPFLNYTVLQDGYGFTIDQWHNNALSSTAEKLKNRILFGE